MSTPSGVPPSPKQAPWVCAACNVPLRPAKVNIAYLGNAFPVELLKCPQCGIVWIPEDLALGRMADVEKTLEDK